MAAKTVGEEVREMAIGMLGDVHVTIILPRRVSVTRLISMRKARESERAHYEKYFTADLERMARTESRTDMARLRRLTEVELDNAIAADFDWDDVPADWHLKAEAVSPERKKLLSLRLDADVIEWFKQQGTGYQTRMNAVLRSFMEHEERRHTG